MIAPVIRENKKSGTFTVDPSQVVDQVISPRRQVENRKTNTFSVQNPQVQYTLFPSFEARAYAFKTPEERRIYDEAVASREALVAARRACFEAAAKAAEAKKVALEIKIAQENLKFMEQAVSHDFSKVEESVVVVNPVLEDKSQATKEIEDLEIQNQEAQLLVWKAEKDVLFSEQQHAVAERRASIAAKRASVVLGDLHMATEFADVEDEETGNSTSVIVVEDDGGETQTVKKKRSRKVIVGVCCLLAAVLLALILAVSLSTPVPTTVPTISPTQTPTVLPTNSPTISPNYCKSLLPRGQFVAADTAPQYVRFQIGMWEVCLGSPELERCFLKSSDPPYQAEMILEEGSWYFQDELTLEYFKMGDEKLVVRLELRHAHDLHRDRRTFVYHALIDPGLGCVTDFASYELIYVPGEGMSKSLLNNSMNNNESFVTWNSKSFDDFTFELSNVFSAEQEPKRHRAWYGLDFSKSQSPFVREFMRNPLMFFVDEDSIVVDVLNFTQMFSADPDGDRPPGNFSFLVGINTTRPILRSNPSNLSLSLEVSNQVFLDGNLAYARGLDVLFTPMNTITNVTDWILEQVPSLIRRGHLAHSFKHTAPNVTANLCFDQCEEMYDLVLLPDCYQNCSIVIPTPEVQNSTNETVVSNPLPRRQLFAGMSEMQSNDGEWTSKDAVQIASSVDPPNANLVEIFDKATQVKDFLLEHSLLGPEVDSIQRFAESLELISDQVGLLESDVFQLEVQLGEMYNALKVGNAIQNLVRPVANQLQEVTDILDVCSVVPVAAAVTIPVTNIIKPIQKVLAKFLGMIDKVVGSGLDAFVTNAASSLVFIEKLRTEFVKLGVVASRDLLPMVNLLVNFEDLKNVFDVAIPLMDTLVGMVKVARPMTLKAALAAKSLESLLRAVGPVKNALVQFRNNIGLVVSKYNALIKPFSDKITEFLNIEVNLFDIGAQAREKVVSVCVANLIQPCLAACREWNNVWGFQSDFRRRLRPLPRTQMVRWRKMDDTGSYWEPILLVQEANGIHEERRLGWWKDKVETPFKEHVVDPVVENVVDPIAVPIAREGGKAWEDIKAESGRVGDNLQGAWDRIETAVKEGKLPTMEDVQREWEAAKKYEKKWEEDAKAFAQSFQNEYHKGVQTVKNGAAVVYSVIEKAGDAIEQGVEGFKEILSKAKCQKSSCDHLIKDLGCEALGFAMVPGLPLDMNKMKIRDILKVLAKLSKLNPLQLISELFNVAMDAGMDALNGLFSDMLLPQLSNDLARAVTESLNSVLPEDLKCWLNGDPLLCSPIKDLMAKVTAVLNAPLVLPTLSPFSLDIPCENGKKSESETDVDCGGPVCSKRCGFGRMCLQQSDCAFPLQCTSGVCSSSRPTAKPSVSPSTDHCENGNLDELGASLETDVDCGGFCKHKRKCLEGKHCFMDDDCETGLCLVGFCVSKGPTVLPTQSPTNLPTRAPTCGCGAAPDYPIEGCPACGAGYSCVRDSQCTSGICESGLCVNPCSPGCRPIWMQNGQCDAPCETSACSWDNQKCCCGDFSPKDSGCPLCGTGSRCSSDGQCSSGMCDNGRCIVPCSPGCRPSMRGGGCDGSCNTKSCDWDNGACFQRLRSFHPQCDTPSRFRNNECIAAIHRWCNQYQYGSTGLGVGESDGAIIVTCFDSISATNVHISELTNQHPQCGPEGSTAACYSAMFRWCRNRHPGHGDGIAGAAQEFLNDDRTVHCFTAPLLTVSRADIGCDPSDSGAAHCVSQLSSWCQANAGARFGSAAEQSDVHYLVHCKQANVIGVYP